LSLFFFFLHSQETP